MDNASLVSALGPAFAAGFAVQRLLEILDPLVARLLGEDRKKIYLGLLSLLAGLGFTYGAGLKVLAYLITDKTGGLFRYLDLLVTALVISAGTEGFNSILKFLNYKKEEKKAESVEKKLEARKAFSLRKEGTMALTADPNDLTLTTPEDVMKEALQNRVREFKNDPELSLNFDDGKFNQHMVSDDQARRVTIDATEKAAGEFQRVLNGKGREIIRDSITVNTGYGAAVGVMEEALTDGADPKPLDV
ncbi:MAG TPA: hypothetical protein VEM96_02400 [Pyrinomonadaceae bacterium]|nr:hypothetical protein [Pyrinomonadaceae bacterium]